MRTGERILLCLYIALAITLSIRSLNWSTHSVFLAALVIMYTPHFERKSTQGFRFGWAALILGGLFLLQGFRTVGFSALVCGLCLFQENYYRRIAPSTLLAFLLATPALSWFADSFSFPIRLKITELAGQMMHLAGLSVSVNGNLITSGAQTFSVDPVCMGLHMMIASLLCCLLLLNYYQGRQGLRLPLWVILLILLGTILLNIVSNLFRIIFLVLLVILPDNPLHEILGLFILGIYVLVPLAYASPRIVRGLGKATPLQPARFRGASPLILVSNYLVFIALLTATIVVWTRRPVAPSALSGVSGYTLHPLETGIIQLENEHALVYIKPIPTFCYTGHSPNICWQGSGYTFSNLREVNSYGTRIFEGIMKKDKELLYTAWWYDNGAQQTIDPFAWRWDQLFGAPGYSIVNITCSTPEELDAEIDHVLEKHSFHHLLAQVQTR